MSNERRLGNIYGFGGGNYAGNVYDVGGVAPTIRTYQGGNQQPMIIDDIYNSREARIYEDYAPALRSERTGLKTVEEIEVVGSLYYNQSPDFDRGLLPDMARTIKADTHPLAVLEEVPISTNGTEVSGTIRATYYKNGTRNIEENVMHGLGYEGVVEPQVMTSKRTEYGKQIRKDYESHNVYEKRANMTELESREDSVSNTITTVQKDNMVLEPQACAMRGRNPENPSDRTSGVHTEQRIEISGEPDVGNCLTSVAKDSMVMESEAQIIQNPHGFNKGNIHDIAPSVTSSYYQENNFVMRKYRIRKLTPRETWRLMNISNEDFNKAEKVNSNTKLYMQSGNSIVVNVLVAIFGQMFDGKENVYKERVAFA